MSKGLEALKRIKREAGTPYFSTLYDIDMWVEDLATIEKELKNYEKLLIEKTEFDRKIEKKLKALEIIKETDKEINDYLTSGVIILKPKTQEEYDLLKEVLKDD